MHIYIYEPSQKLMEKRVHYGHKHTNIEKKTPEVCRMSMEDTVKRYRGSLPIDKNKNNET